MARAWLRASAVRVVRVHAVGTAAISSHENQRRSASVGSTRVACQDGYSPAQSPVRAPRRGPKTSQVGTIADQSFERDTPTTVATPAAVPMTPPMRPRAADSARNCDATCLGLAPNARRSPISETRSSTATSVVLAIPKAPMTSEMPARRMKRLVRSVETLFSREYGSGGAMDRKYSGWSAGPGARPDLRRPGPSRQSSSVAASGCPIRSGQYWTAPSH
jgi:hypothetical protein